MSRPASRVAVLMPAYNAEKLIHRALRSLSQSTYPFDLFIVDDGSTVPVSQMLRDYPQATIIRLDVNVGVARAKNEGLKAIIADGYDFVANCDADDLCYPERIRRQVELLDRRPEVAVVGTWSRAFAEATGDTLLYGRQHEDAASVRAAMRYNSGVNHSSTMIRVRTLREMGLYSEDYPAAEDYELFRRIGARHDIVNIPEVLMDISISPTGVSLKRRRRQLFDRLAIQLKYFEAAHPGAWLGVAKTLVLFAVPVSVVAWLKSSAVRQGKEPEAQVADDGQVNGAPRHT